MFYINCYHRSALTVVTVLGLEGMTYITLTNKTRLKEQNFVFRLVYKDSY